MKISDSRLLYSLLIINPILSLAFDATTVYYHYIMYPLIMFLILFKEKKQHKLFNKSIIICGCIALCEIVAIVFGGQLGKLHNHLFNFVDASLFMIYFTRDENIQELIEYTRKKLNRILTVVIAINIVEAFMILTHRGYVYVYSWHGNFFSGTSNMPHTLSYLMLATIILNIVYIILTRKKAAAILAIVPTYCVFISGARVALLLCAILDAIILSFVLSEKQKNIFVKFIKIMPLILVVGFLLKDRIMDSDLMMKITSRSASGNSTAGRTYIWADLLYRYITCGNPLFYIFGMGDDKSYYFNGINPLVASEVWAHNDLVQIIIGKGVVGIGIYISCLMGYFKKLIKTSGNIYQ